MAFIQAKTGLKPVQNGPFLDPFNVSNPGSTALSVALRRQKEGKKVGLDVGAAVAMGLRCASYLIGHAAWTPTLQGTLSLFLPTRRSKPSPTYDFDPLKTGENSP